jgi:hypothetical protein
MSSSYLLYKWHAGWSLPSVDPASTQAEVCCGPPRVRHHAFFFFCRQHPPPPPSPPPSPFSQAYLRLAGVPLTVQECTGSRSAPTGALRALSRLALRAMPGDAAGRGASLVSPPV